MHTKYLEYGHKLEGKDLTLTKIYLDTKKLPYKQSLLKQDHQRVRVGPKLLVV